MANWKKRSDLPRELRGEQQRSVYEVTEEELRDSDFQFHLRRLGHELGAGDPANVLPELAASVYRDYRGSVISPDGKAVWLDTTLLDAADPYVDEDAVADWDVDDFERRVFDTHRHWWENWFGSEPRRYQSKRLYDDSITRLSVFGSCMRIWCLNRAQGIGLLAISDNQSKVMRKEGRRCLR